MSHLTKCAAQIQRLVSSLIFLLLFCVAQPLLATQTLTFNGVVSILGTGSNSLGGPVGIVVDPSWNVYIADTANNRILKVAPNGVTSVLAITGLTSPSTLTAPKALAVDGAGNLFIADSGNSRIVEVNSSGSGSIVSTGSVSLSAPQGLAIDAAGDIFISDTGHNQIVEVPATGTPSVYNITGVTSPSTLSSPRGLAEDSSGNLYIADAGNSRIVKVTSGGVGSKLAITGESPTTPAGVAVDSFGNLYIADSGAGDVIAVTTSLVGTSFSERYGLSNASPAGVAVDVFGNVLVADTGNNHIDQVQTRSVGFGHMQLGPTATSVSVALIIGSAEGPDLTNLQVTTLGNSNLDFKVSGDDTSCMAGTANLATCNIGVQYFPVAPGFRQGGMVLTYFDTTVTPQVARSITVPLYAFNDAPQAALYPGTASVISSGSVATQDPYQVAVDGSGNTYVSSVTGNNVVKINAGGGNASVVNTGTYTLGAVNGVAVDGAGDLFIADNQNSAVYEVTAAGATYQLSINLAGSPASLSGPTALVLDGVGNLFIADNGDNRVLKVALQDPTLATTFPLNGTVVNTGVYTFSGNTITGLAVDAAENLYIVDSKASNIVKVTPQGAATTVAFPGLTTALSSPQGVAVDGMGNLYVTDAGNGRIVQLTTAGVASVVPIQGLTNPSTLGGASGQNLFGVSVDSSGNIYIADSENNRVVKVNVSGASLTFASTKEGSTSTDSPKTATIANLGNQPLVFSAAPVYTASFVENTEDTNLCASTTSLLPGTGCDVSVMFAPQSVGSLSGHIWVTDNTLNVVGSTQQVWASGTGLTPGDSTVVAVAASPASLYIGQPTTITATVTDTTSGSTTPTGSVTFIDSVGSTSITLNGGSPVELSGGAATLTSVVLSGTGIHTITANYAGVTGSFMTSNNTTAVAVFPTAATTTTVQTSSATVLAQSGVTFTATVSCEECGTPTGSVSFMDGSALLGSATLNNAGKAALTTSTLSVGTHNITGVFTGNAAFLASTSTAVAETVQDFNFTASGSTTTATALSSTVTPGGTAVYKLQFTPVGASTFSSAVAFTLTGLPAGATYTIAPSTIAAGSGTTTVTVTVNVASQQTVAAVSPRGNGGWPKPIAYAMMLPLFGMIRLRRVLRAKGKTILPVLLLLGIMAAMAMAGCGNGSGFFSQTPQTYPMTLTGTSGALHHSVSLNLTVQ